ncbi:28S ribosomal protein S33, mitochondrial [Aplysia californica]|uniref:Small ribosomal subunit protein mS33 n=1 Tax=Aplysia californica TaxID=6500 RepID=A0ABM0K1I9_APLCA|nr:28S ribosomal protein S33, mitochondrial [Aplysia californica]XP_035827823.1 28S ribosomal protein S33, mitochondrial [Aplysia californica]
MSEYARRMSFLASRIFGEVVKGTSHRNEKVVQLLRAKPMDKNNFIVNYYPPYMKMDLAFQNLRHHGLYRDEHQDFKEEMIRQRILRGKIKPKKGEGKRAMKRKS